MPFLFYERFSQKLQSQDLNKENFKFYSKWKEVLGVGRKKARWDGNGKEREWKKRKLKERINNYYSLEASMCAKNLN